MGKRLLFAQLNDTSATMQTKLWATRILVDLGMHRAFISSERGVADSTLASAMGLLDEADSGHDLDPVKIRSRLFALHQRLLQRASRIRPPAAVVHNVDSMGDMLGLSGVERRLLVFAACLHTDPILELACDNLGQLTTLRAHVALSRILALPASTVRKSLAPGGVLARSGVLEIEEGTGSLEMKLRLLSSAFGERLRLRSSSPFDLLKKTVTIAAPAELQWSDYAHVESLDVVRAYVQHAVEARRPGANILLYGPPGTGKTQLARLLASDSGCELFEVATQDEDGDSIGGEARLRAYRAAQTLLQERRALVLFDEVSDVFAPPPEPWGRAVSQSRKGWLNRILEEGRVPSLWLTNSLDNMDPAILRRFDIVMELPVPPRSHRRRIISGICGDLVPAATVNRLANLSVLSPAVVARTTSVVRAIRGKVGTGNAAGVLSRLIESSLQAQRLDFHCDATQDSDVTAGYDLSCLSTDADLAAISEGIRRSKSGRLCLYGPPGTGKTEFGRWLARDMELPLHVKRASDLLSPYLGMTEKNLAAAFREASADRGVLMIDEVDSFLGNRATASRSWEVTQVNEMLTQMERFEGIFIASTNLADSFDSAALRRFDLKIRFDYLRASQVLRLFHRCCKALDLAAIDPGDEARVGKLLNLTPGDFSVVMRQHRFNPLRDARDFVQRLVAESTLKQPPKAPIGFVH